MIYFTDGPGKGTDPIYRKGHEDVTHALKFYRERIEHLMDREDSLPGRFMVSSETGQLWRVEVRMEVSTEDLL